MPGGWLAWAGGLGSSRGEMRVLKIILVLFVLALGTPAMASVSLGEIEVRSFLNQPLQAQIRAQGSALLDEGLDVRLASEAAYQRAGLSRAAVPADLDIQLEGTGTSRIVRLTTQRPVREPYVGLLLEVRWGAGRVLREYTILLDPPVAFTRERSAAPVVTGAQTTDRAPAATRTATRTPRAGVYAVRPGDNLLAIVRRQGYSGVSANQAMLAILEANPRAFADGNVHRLLAGAQLELPSEEAMAAVDPGVARAAIQRQTEIWRGGVAPQAPTTPPPEPADPAPPEVESLPEGRDPDTQTEPAAAAAADDIESAAASEDAGDEAAAAVAGDGEPLATDRLEILGEQDPASGQGNGQSTQVIEEALLSQQTAMAELRDELISLRGEVAERDQMITVMNSELAQLEQRLREMPAQPGADARVGTSGEDIALHQRIATDPLLSLLALTSMLLLLLLLVSVFRPVRSKAALVQDVPASPTGATEVPPTPAARAAERATASAGAVAAPVGAGLVATGAPQAAKEPQPQPPSDSDKGASREEDLLADLDLYLAYGMNDQAISVLENAIKEGHDSPEYRIRLIEAHAANGDAEAVRAHAATLRERLGPGDDALRERITAAEGRVDAAADASPAGAPAGAGNAPEGDIQGNSLEFEAFDAPETEAVPAASKPGPAAEEDDDNMLRFDLDAIDAGDSPDPSSGSKGPQTGKPSAAEEDELAMLDLPDFDAPSEATPVPAAAGSGSEADTSENGMKLSLAEAFVEMGDREGALSLLDEIKATATSEQMAKAEQIRGQIEGSQD